MDEKKLPIRKKGRAETIIEDLGKHGLIIAGIAVEGYKEKIIIIDSDDPYKDGSVFTESDFYRIYEGDGQPVIDLRRLSAVRRWIDSGEIEKHRQIAEERARNKETESFLNKLTEYVQTVRRMSKE